MHPPLQYLPMVERLPGKPIPHLNGKTLEGMQRRYKNIGCRCEFDLRYHVIDPTCMNTVNLALH